MPTLDCEEMPMTVCVDVYRCAVCDSAWPAMNAAEAFANYAVAETAHPGVTCVSKRYVYSMRIGERKGMTGTCTRCGEKVLYISTGTSGLWYHTSGRKDHDANTYAKRD